MSSDEENKASCPLGNSIERLFDVDGALSRADGDRDLLSELMEMYLIQSCQDIKDIELAISKKDAKRLEFVAHSLKGSSATLAAETARALAYKMEKIGSSGTLSEAPALLLKLKETIGLTNEEISRALGTIRAQKEE